jgi:hypothetical protein
MATKAWSDWFDEVLPEVPGCGSDIVTNAIRNAAIELCDRALIWRIDQGPIAVAPYANVYDWEPLANTDPARPMQVWLAGLPLEPKTANELSDRFGDFMRAAGTPAYFVQDQPASLIIVPMPVSVPTGIVYPPGVQADGLTAKLAIKPARAATGLEQWIADRYHEPIAHGAKARLMRMPRKPWTDKPSSADYQMRFDDAVAKALLEGARGFSGARTRAKPQFL